MDKRNQLLNTIKNSNINAEINSKNQDNVISKPVNLSKMDIAPVNCSLLEGKVLNPSENNENYGLGEMLSIPNRQLIKLTLQCSLCSRIPKPIAYMCKDGHLICQICSKSVPYCPKELPSEIGFGSLRKRLCGKRFTMTRNRLYQFILENTITKCRNPGCNKKISEKKLIDHEQTCSQSRTVPCQWKNYCRFPSQIHLDMYPLHLQTTHDVKMIYSQRQCCLIDYYTTETKPFITTMFYNGKETFSLNVQYTKKLVYIFMTQMQHHEEIKNNFECFTQLISPQGNGQMYQGRIRSFMQREETVELGKCLTVAKKVLPAFIINVGGRDKLIVEIFIYESDLSPAAFNWERCVTEDTSSRKQGTDTQSMLTSVCDAFDMFQYPLVESSQAYSEREIITPGLDKFTKMYDDIFGKPKFL